MKLKIKALSFNNLKIYTIFVVIRFLNVLGTRGKDILKSISFLSVYITYGCCKATMDVIQ